MSLSVQRLLNFAGEASINSDLKIKHGAVIGKGSKKIVCGHNHSRTKHGHNLSCSFHAEMDAVLTWCSVVLKGKDIQCLL